MPTAVGSFISNRKSKALMLGWLGIILSGVLQGCFSILVYMQSEMEKWLKNGLLACLNKKEQQTPMIMLATFRDTIYGLSLLNTGASVFLLIGLDLNIIAFLYPWLLFNGSLFALSCLLALYSIKAVLFRDLLSFLPLILVLTLIIATFYKIYHAVYNVVIVMRQQKRFRRSRPNRG